MRSFWNNSLSWKYERILVFLYNYGKRIIINLLYFNNLNMKNIPIAMKIVLNIIFFIVYSIITMNFTNFLFDSILHFSWKVVPKSNDIVHLKIAWVVLIFVLFLTILFRKYFYLSLDTKKVKKQTNKKKKTINKEEENKEENEKLKIYIDKEIK